MRPIFLTSALLLLCHLTAWNQPLQPGFDVHEYHDLMLIALKTNNNMDSVAASYPDPDRFKLRYISDSIGLDNLWELWTDEKETAVICVRGTTPHLISWEANFYSAMIPAKGSLQVTDSYTFDYILADDPHAAVHIGWTLSLGFLSREILPAIDSLYRSGTRNFLLTGHSQGGAITYLLTAYLMKLRQHGKLPSDLLIKGYCIAAPKPGNLYFAYEYEHMTNHGWAFNVVNSADWVPETPVSIQTLNDFNETNPFVNARREIKKMKFPKNLALRYVYDNLDKPTRKAQKKYEKFLGDLIAKNLQKDIPGYAPPNYYQSNHYVRTGEIIVLYADEDYYQHYPNSHDDFWIHHHATTYYDLFRMRYGHQLSRTD